MIKYDKMYMEMARAAAKQSKAKKRKVGAIAVDKNGNIIGVGINGTPTGWINNEDIDPATGKTAEFVLHAEENLISKISRSSASSESATLYVTTAPCIKCARLIAQSGFTRVVCGEEYKTNSGINLLSTLNIEVVENID